MVHLPSAPESNAACDVYKCARGACTGGQLGAVEHFKQVYKRRLPHLRLGDLHQDYVANTNSTCCHLCRLLSAMPKTNIQHQHAQGQSQPCLYNRCWSVKSTSEFLLESYCLSWYMLEADGCTQCQTGTFDAGTSGENIACVCVCVYTAHIGNKECVCPGCIRAHHCL